jgi:hypothetical protein
MVRYKYVRIRIEDIPEEIIVKYKLHDKVSSDGHVYVEIQKGMYGLPQAGILAQKLLEKQMNEHGYSQSKAVPGLWTHKPDPSPLHWLSTTLEWNMLERNMQCIWLVFSGSIMKFPRIGQVANTLEDYHDRRVHLSMPGYITNALQHFGHEHPRRMQNLPHPHVAPTYGAKVQYVKLEAPSIPLDKDGQKYIQAITGTLLYYSHAVDSTMLVALTAIATQQASPTQKTMERV